MYFLRYACITVKTEREDENEQNDDISDRTEGYTTTKTDKVDEHVHDKAKHTNRKLIKSMNMVMIKPKHTNRKLIKSMNMVMIKPTNVNRQRQHK